MARAVRLALVRRACTLAAVVTLVTACAHAPRDDETRGWLAAAPAATAIVDGSEKLCRKRLELGTRIPVTRCLTREEELRERRRATTLLGLVGGGHFRDGG